MVEVTENLHRREILAMEHDLSSPRGRDFGKSETFNPVILIRLKKLAGRLGAGTDRSVASAKRPAISPSRDAG